MRRFVVAEFDPHAEAVRPLGKSGEFLTGTSYREEDIAYFLTEVEAERAIAAAPNKRSGCKVEIIGSNRRPVAA
jgi:hypothetical protein